MSKQLKADIALLLVTIGWGISFILTKNSLKELPTYNFLAIRFFIAFAISSFIFVKKMIKINKQTIFYSIILGIMLYAAYAFQTVGLNYTSASKSAFITGLNVILVPVFLTIMMKKFPNKKILLSSILALIGLGLLTLNDDITRINIGDIYTFLSAIVLALHIIYVGKYTVKVESISLAIIQLGIVSLLSFLTSLATENPIIPENPKVWFNIIFLSIICTSGAFIVQSIAQRYTSSTHTALIYTCEPVFAGVFGYVLLGEVLSTKGTIGAVLIISSMLLAELKLDVILEKLRLIKNKISTQNSSL